MHRAGLAVAVGNAVPEIKEPGRAFRITTPKYPPADSNYRILVHQRSRSTHFYFYIRDEVLGPIVLRVASFFPSQAA
jgi:hypothetical protein